MRVVVVVAARNEADRIGATLDSLADALPGAQLVVADDASTDRTAEVAMLHGAEVVSRRRPHGKGGSMTAAAESVLPLLLTGEAGVPATGSSRPEGDRTSRVDESMQRVVLLCDGDLGSSAGRLGRLVEAVGGGECDLAVAAFSRRVGGGLGIAVGFAGWAIRRRCGFRAEAPISGQRALTVEALRAALPFAPRYGMEMGMTIDVARAGMRVGEYCLDLEHRATGRTLGGFIHRGRQLRDFLGVYLGRRRR